MNKNLLAIVFLFAAIANIQGQTYVSHTYLGYQRNTGELKNPYTNTQLADVTEKINFGILEWGVEGMDKNMFVNFKSHFLGVIPDYLFRAADKNNRAGIYSSLLENFQQTYNTVPTQYQFNASFSDWDIMGGNLSYGYKYVFVGGNFAWSSTTVQAYQSVDNITIKEVKPANYTGFNSKANFTYGANVVIGNNNPEKPIRLIVAYDWLLMRDYQDKWRNDMGTRMTYDLQMTLPKLYKRIGVYAGLVYRTHEVIYDVDANGLALQKTFSSALTSLKLGINW